MEEKEKPQPRIAYIKLSQEKPWLIRKYVTRPEKTGLIYT